MRPTKKQLRQLAKARQAAELSHSDLADKLGVSRPYVSMAERGVKAISLPLLRRWCRAVGLELFLEIRKKSA